MVSGCRLKIQLKPDRLGPTGQAITHRLALYTFGVI